MTPEMKTFTRIVYILSVVAIFSGCKINDEYQVYAIRFKDGYKIQAKDYVIGADLSDSVEVCNMFWLLKSRGGKNILVDAGFLDTSFKNKNYTRPDSMLLRVGLTNQDISDIIITHPHFDHINGITLFPEARIWMQQADYEYFTGPAWQENGDHRGFEKKDVENILSVKARGRLNLIKGDGIEIFPGIRVYTGSKHTFENQFLLVNSGSGKNKVLLASDAIWFSLNLEKQLPISICMDTAQYVKAMIRMKTLVVNPDLIIPGHENKIFSKFPKVQDGIVRIEE